MGDYKGTAIPLSTFSVGNRVEDPLQKVGSSSPHWWPVKTLQCHSRKSSVKDWLLDSGSLTNIVATLELG